MAHHSLHCADVAIKKLLTHPRTRPQPPISHLQLPQDFYPQFFAPNTRSYFEDLETIALPFPNL